MQECVEKFCGIPIIEDPCSICNTGVGTLEAQTSTMQGGEPFMFFFYVCDHCGSEYGTPHQFETIIYADNI